MNLPPGRPEGADTAEAIVDTTAGRLRGSVTDTVAAFKGIQYAASVSGRRRWQRALPVAPWTGIRDALEFGPRAIQPEARDMKVGGPEVEALMSAGAPADDGWKAQSEECLTLSVWAPRAASSRKRPVMFWCHGGKYFGEVPPVWWFDGENLARTQDVVVVAARHRVGVMGFLHLADLPGGAAYEDAANIGMLDLVDALEWVRANAERFGGDPDNVTLFGESGGGLKVSVLLGMRQAKGLFHKAIVQSGAQLEAGSRATGTERALALLTELGLTIDDVDQLFDVPSERLNEAQVRLNRNLWGPPDGRPWADFEPIVDGHVLGTDCFDPIASPVSAGVALLVGTCATETTFFLGGVPGVFEASAERMRAMAEGMLRENGERIVKRYEASRPQATPAQLLIAITSDFLFWRKAIRMAELKSQQASAPVYMYLLAFGTDVHGGKYGTPHTLDIPLVFAHPQHPVLGSDPGRFAVSRQMSGAWAAFARTGDPSTALLPPWPVYEPSTRATMVFDVSPRVEFDPRSQERQAWSTP